MRDSVEEPEASTRASGRWAHPVTFVGAAIALAVVPFSNDGFADVKMLLVTAVVAVQGWLVCRDRTWSTGRRLGSPGWAMAAFLAIAAVATLTSDAPLLSFMGAEQRYNGLFAYAVGAALMVLIARMLPLIELGTLLRVLAAGGAVSVLYWLAQLAGWDPLGTKPPEALFSVPEPFFSTLGNPNFAGAFVALALPAGLWAVATASGGRARLPWAAAVALLVTGALGSASLQAPIAAAAGVLVLAIAWALGRNRRLALGLVVAGLIMAGVAALGLLRVGPAAVLGRQDTFVSRTWDWAAAVDMARTEPLTGVGFARFGGYVRVHRPPPEVLTYGWTIQADAAHSVPLDLAAGGGLPLLAAYVVFTGLVGARLLGGLRDGNADRLLLGAFGGMWAAYHVQSLVSIDMMQVNMLHFLAVGGILAATARETPSSATPPASGGRASILARRPGSRPRQHASRRQRCCSRHGSRRTGRCSAAPTHGPRIMRRPWTPTLTRSPAARASSGTC